MNKNLFSFATYKAFMRATFDQKGARSGFRKAAAAAMGCQTSYLSKVLNENAQLSLEQGVLLTEFLGLDELESDFFLLLLQKDRAGSRKLEFHFQKKIADTLERRSHIKNRIQTEAQLSTEEQTIYYSNWYYSCIHVMLSIPNLRTKAALVEILGLAPETVGRVLSFLEQTGLAVRNGNEYFIGPRHIHLGHDSPHIYKHHFNWRIKAMQSLDHVKSDDLHYSVVVTLSQEDLPKIRQKLLDVIQENMKVIKDSKEDQAAALCIDWFMIDR